MSVIIIIKMEFKTRVKRATVKRRTPLQVHHSSSENLSLNPNLASPGRASQQIKSSQHIMIFSVKIFRLKTNGFNEWKGEIEVGRTGFEPATPPPPEVCATKLRYRPMSTFLLVSDRFVNRKFSHL